MRTQYRLAGRNLISLTLVFLTTAAASSCRRSVVLRGDYDIDYVWVNGSLQSVAVKKSTGAQAVPPAAQKQVAEIAVPIIRGQLQNANLNTASGSLALTIEGDPPYLTVVRDFRIRVPDFEQLSAAVESENVASIRAIVTQHKNVNQRELPSLNTGLEIAAAGGHVKSARILLDCGADPNMANGIGITPLMAAVMADSEQTVRALIDAGANVHVVNKSGDSAVSLAQKLDRPHLLRILLQTRTQHAPVGGTLKPFA